MSNKIIKIVEKHVVDFSRIRVIVFSCNHNLFSQLNIVVCVDFYHLKKMGQRSPRQRGNPATSACDVNPWTQMRSHPGKSTVKEEKPA